MDSLIINAVLVDDEEKSRQNLRKLLQLYCKNVVVLAEADSIDVAWRVLDTVAPDVVFLDIEMTDGSGFHLLDLIRQRNFGVIFVTAHSHYAIKAFKYEALDYLLKPIDIDELMAAVKKIKPLAEPVSTATASRGTLEYLEVKLPEGVVYVAHRDILRLQADGSYTFLYLTSGDKHCLSYNIGTFEEKLGTGFFRVHKSHIINLRFIKKITRATEVTVEMADNTKIDVSRRIKSAFLQTVQRFRA